MSACSGILLCVVGVVLVVDICLQSNQMDDVDYKKGKSVPNVILTNKKIFCFLQGASSRWTSAVLIRTNYTQK